jgi:Na+-transporting methylmalonyl-CoA/oxaloacetate decarboxylase gamma subunit
MENAASALQMAVGVLIALLLISLFVFVFNSISGVENSKADAEVQKENVEFNNKFLAFDKSSMYGTDLISILGLAISNNQIYNQANTANPNGMYHENVDGTIDIRFRLLENVYTKTTYYKFFSRHHQNSDGSWASQWDKDTTKSPNPATNKVLDKNILYTLETNVGYNAIERIAIEGNSNVSQKVTGNTMIETDTSGFNDLKKRIFTCTNVEYNGVGRIYRMTFEEKAIN